MTLTTSRRAGAVVLVTAALAVVAVSSPGVWRASTGAEAMRDPCAGYHGKTLKACRSSRLPATYTVADMGRPYFGKGKRFHSHHGGRSIARLRGPATRPDRSYTLVIARGRISLNGRRTPAITVNGQTPGPVIRAAQGDLVKVTLVNKNIRAGVTIHWHGIDLPDAEDGVAGVTQNAVLPGHRFVYRFRADDAGTYWYHSHQRAVEQVGLGFLGAVVIQPRTGPAPGVVDKAAVLHTYNDNRTINGNPAESRVVAAAGSMARVRFVNSDDGPMSVTAGAPFRVAAIDGRDLNGPTDLTNTYVTIPAGGRYDLMMPIRAQGVRVGRPNGPSMVLGPAGAHPPPLGNAGKEFDPLTYGSPTGSRRLGPVDRRFTFRVGLKSGFLNGDRGNWFSINRQLIPRVPMYMVKHGDVVRLHYFNADSTVHPLHLHGHHMIVLSRNGKPATGSPWWIDSLDVQPGEDYVLEFRADNPGIWMFHCHNLPHVAQGLMTHLAYKGYRTPYSFGRVGKRLINFPE